MKLFISIFILVFVIAGGILSVNHTRWLHYKNNEVPFEVMYPTSLTATTTFISFGSAYHNAAYPVVRIGTKDEIYFFATVSPKSRTIDDVLKYGNGSHIPQYKIILDGKEGVVLKGLVGDKPYMLDQAGYDVILMDDVLEYDISVRYALGDQILKTFKLVSL